MRLLTFIILPTSGKNHLSSIGKIQYVVGKSRFLTRLYDARNSGMVGSSPARERV